MSFRHYIFLIFFGCCSLQRSTAFKQKNKVHALLEVYSSGYQLRVSEHQLEESFAHEFKEPLPDISSKNESRSVAIREFRDWLGRGEEIKNIWKTYISDSESFSTRVSVHDLIVALRRFRSQKMSELSPGETLDIPNVPDWGVLIHLLDMLPRGFSFHRDGKIGFGEFATLMKNDKFSRYMGFAPVDSSMHYLRQLWETHFASDDKPINSEQYYQGLRNMLKVEFKDDGVELGAFEDELLDFDDEFRSGDRKLSFDEWVATLGLGSMGDEEQEEELDLPLLWKTYFAPDGEEKIELARYYEGLEMMTKEAFEEGDAPKLGTFEQVKGELKHIIGEFDDKRMLSFDDWVAIARHELTKKVEQGAATWR